MKGSPSLDVTPWYKDTSTWLYIIGVGCTIGIAYFGYKLYSDPSWFYNLISTPDSETVTPGSPIIIGPTAGPSNIPLPPSPDITLTNNLTKGFIAGIIKPFSNIKAKINPFNYILSSTEVNNQFQNFMEFQNNPTTADRRYYPFTEVI